MYILQYSATVNFVVMPRHWCVCMLRYLYVERGETRRSTGARLDVKSERCSPLIAVPCASTVGACMVAKYNCLRGYNMYAGSSSRRKMGYFQTGDFATVMTWEPSSDRLYDSAGGACEGFDFGSTNGQIRTEEGKLVESISRRSQAGVEDRALYRHKPGRLISPQINRWRRSIWWRCSTHNR